MKETCDKLAEYKKINYKWFGEPTNASYQMFNYNNMYDFIDFISLAMMLIVIYDYLHS